MIRGMSREKPALVFLRCIEIAWSLYEMMGDRTMKTGARRAVASFMSPNMVGGMRAWHATRGFSERSDGGGEQRRKSKPCGFPGGEGEEFASADMLSVAHGCGVACDGGRRSMGVLRKFGVLLPRPDLHMRKRGKSASGSEFLLGPAPGVAYIVAHIRPYGARDEPGKIRSGITSRGQHLDVMLRSRCYRI